MIGKQQTAGMVVSLFLCLPALAVNKCIGADGRVSFQDAPCPRTTTMGDDLTKAKQDAQQRSDAAVQSRKSIAADLEAQLAEKLKNRPLPIPQPSDAIPAPEVSSTSAHMPFSQCTATVRATIQSLGANRKDVHQIVNTAEMAVTKICTIDGSVTLTCSALDTKLITTRSAHKCP